MIEALSQLLRRQSSPTDGAALARSAKVVRKLLARVTGP
jgi:hypothetical protein